ncbi:hypothetical protein, partial [Paracoccus sanguinis]|uniref:hypothetical protein n=1 Tax=Paracoccus sanguinis TaxID=1545044 RepID=UPI001E6247FC
MRNAAARRSCRWRSAQAVGTASICGPRGLVLPVLRIVQGVGPLAGREALDDAAMRNAAARRSCRWRSAQAVGPASICGPCGLVLPVLRIVQGVGPLAGREALDDAAMRNAAARRSCRWRSAQAVGPASVCGPCGLVLPVLRIVQGVGPL